MPSYYRLLRAWNELLKYTPRSIRASLRNVSAPWLGYLESIFTRKHEMIPPLRSRVQAGLGGWNEIGKEFVEMFVELAGLRSDEKVLEVGCGYGRIAIALAGYLGEHGKYEGFDVVPEAVEWCRAKIASRFSNFHFQVADVFNEVYNPTGRYCPSEYRFPYEDASFDFVFLTSVFTHMLPQDFPNYFREIARVLKQGGRCLATYFLLNQESTHHVDSQASVYDFRAVFRDCRVLDVNNPEAGIAHDEGFVRNLYAKSDLDIVPPIHWGLWCGRRRFRSFQDVVIAEKK